MKKLNQQYDGEWFRPVKRGWLLGCCDCGLIHKVNFRIKDGYIELQAYREPKLSGINRRSKKFIKRGRNRGQQTSLKTVGD